MNIFTVHSGSFYRFVRIHFPGRIVPAREAKCYYGLVVLGLVVLGMGSASSRGVGRSGGAGP